MSLVPVQHLSWQLARNVRFSDQKLFTMIKNILIRSLAYTKMIYNMVTVAGKSVQMHSRHKGDSSPYCSICEVMFTHFIGNPDVSLLHSFFILLWRCACCLLD